MSDVSPRPWEWETNADDQRMVYDAEGNCIAQVFERDADADCIVDAVNGFMPQLNAQKLYLAEAEAEARSLREERDRLRDLVRRFADFIVRASRITGGVYELPGTGFHEEAVALLREAREAQVVTFTTTTTPTRTDWSSIPSSVPVRRCPNCGAVIPEETP